MVFHVISFFSQNNDSSSPLGQLYAFLKKSRRLDYTMYWLKKWGDVKSIYMAAGNVYVSAV